MKKLNDIISPVNEELRKFEEFFVQTLKADTEPMDSIVRYVRDSRGKHLRPILVLLSAKLFSDVNQETFISATIAEMIHSATLIHDDVVDDDDIRRGQSSVKARWGNSTAVLAGDYLLAKAMLMLIQLGDFDIMQEMLYTAAAMSEGELFQNAATEESKVVSQEAYLDIITRKTAMLMRTCCSMGALSVKAPTEQVEKIASFGLNFGILFQLRDDILDNENAEIAQALLPTYLEKAMQDLDGFEPSNIVDALHNLTVFCAEREG